jgi:uncharacterized protein
MQRILSVVTFILLSVSTVAHADETSKRAKVKEWFQLTLMENRVQQSKAAAMAQARAFAAQQLTIFNLPKDMDKSAAAYYEKLYNLVATKYDWSKLGPAYEQIYLDLYSEQELMECSRFTSRQWAKLFFQKRQKLRAGCWRYQNNSTTSSLPKYKN